MAKQSAVTLLSADSHPLRLAGFLHPVEGDGPFPAAVICHPHPLGGGSMHNALVVAIARALAPEGVVALRFNFRGVGASEGFYDNGRGEREDVAGALDWLRAQPFVDPLRVSLVGYSFGACVGLAQALADPSLSAFVGVGLAVEFCDHGVMQPFTGSGQALSQFAPESLSFPKLFITGERDQLAPPVELQKLVQRLPAPKTVHIVPGADHFWWGSEAMVGKMVADFLAGS